MKKPRNIMIPALFIAAVSSCFTARGDTPLGTDNFTNSTGTSVNTVNNTQATGIGTWSSIQGMTSTVMSVVATGPVYGDFGDGNILHNSNASNNTLYRAFNPDVTPFTLNSLSTGNILRLEFDFRIGGGTQGNAENFSFGFISKRTGTGTDNDSVVYANVDLSTVTGTAGLISEFRYRLQSYNMVGSGSQIGSSWTEAEPIFATGGIYHFRLDVTKQSDGGVLLEYYRDNTLTGSELVTGGSAIMTNIGGIAMTGIGIRHGEFSGVSYYYDNISASVITGTAPESAYLSWIGGYSLGGQTALSDDPDNDSIDNGAEFVLKNGNPEVPNTTQIPTSSASGNDLVFSFERDDRAKGGTAGVTVTVEAGTDLTTWPETYTVGADTASSTTPGVVISNDGDANPDTVTVTIPKNAATAKFARLKVVGTP